MQEAVREAGLAGSEAPRSVALEDLTTARYRALTTPEPAHRSSHWLAALTGVQVMVVLGLALGGYVLQRRLDRLASMAAEVRSVAANVQDLAEKTRALGGETLQLRQSLFKSSAEQVLFLKVLVLKPDVNQELARTIARHVHKYADQFGIEPDLVLAIMSIESRFNPDAVSKVGALGLMQVMPQWVKVLGIGANLTDPEVSIRYGLQILSFYVAMYKDIDMALTAYNRGPGPVDTALMRGKDPTNEYPAMVKGVYERLKKLNVTE